MATASDPSASKKPLMKVSILKEGPLFKRQQGRHQTHDSRKLKFHQQRYISLTQDFLFYHKTFGPDHKVKWIDSTCTARSLGFIMTQKGEKRGEFPIARVRIIEKVPDNTFQYPYCFQIGDNDEVMYFRAKTENERKEWMDALLIAATLKQNEMLEVYHIGAYGQVHQNEWSCCNAANRNTPGCERTKVPQGRRMTMLLEDHNFSGVEFIDRRHSVATCSSPDTQSIDSGYPLDSAKYAGGSQLSINSGQSANEVVLKEGYLLKRQQGSQNRPDSLKKLKFQQRYVRLDEKTLDYFKDQKKGIKTGSFLVDQIRIVECIPDVTFRKSFCFQVGDDKEVVYFIAKSDNERKEWMEAFRIACTINKNEMYDWYHIGAFGQVDSNKWSCCNEDRRDSKGCMCREKAATRNTTILSSLKVSSTDEEDSQYPVPVTTSSWEDEEFHAMIGCSSSPQMGLMLPGSNYRHTLSSSLDSGLNLDIDSRFGSQGSLQGRTSRVHDHYSHSMSLPPLMVTQSSSVKTIHEDTSRARPLRVRYQSIVEQLERSPLPILFDAKEAPEDTQSNKEDVQEQDNHQSTTVIGDLMILSNLVIGVGFFGTVFEGRWREMHCAAKVLNLLGQEIVTGLPAGTKGKVQEEALTRFVKECEFMKSIQHPNIVAYFSTLLHPESNLPILVMEQMEISLSRYIGKESALSLRVQRSISCDVAAALDALHEKNIVHRDLCGDNILLNRANDNPIAKVSDFGMSRVIVKYATPTHSLTVMGHRPGFMPPEALQDPAIYDSSLDIFMFGVVMMMIINNIPNVRDRKHRKQLFEQLTMRDQHPFKPIITECLHEDKEERLNASEIYTRLFFLA